MHSSKDMPAVLPDGLDDRRRAAARGSARRGRAAAAWPHGAATSASASALRIDELVARARRRRRRSAPSSVRRIAQLTRLLPGARFVPIRGNLDTRLRKLDDGELRRARAGGGRPAPARIRVAHLAARCRSTRACRRRARASSRSRSATATTRSRARGRARSTMPRRAAALDAERALVAALGGGCQTPIGALASPRRRRRARARSARRRRARRQPRRPRHARGGATRRRRARRTSPRSCWPTAPTKSWRAPTMISRLSPLVGRRDASLSRPDVRCRHGRAAGSMRPKVLSPRRTPRAASGTHGAPHASPPFFAKWDRAALRRYQTEDGERLTTVTHDRRLTTEG